jgi:hypothetical protein
MKKKSYKIKSKVWLYPGMAGWHFVSVPKKESVEIKKNFGQNPKKKRGFGSIPVTVHLGHSTWETSIFPDKRSNTYLMPLKAQVRKKEDIWNGDKVSIDLTIR